MWGFRRRREHERDVIDVRANIAAKTPQIAEPWESVARQVAELSPRAISELVALPADRNKMALDNAQLDDWAREGSPEWAEVFAELRHIGRRLDVLGACVSPGRYLEAFWGRHRVVAVLRPAGPLQLGIPDYCSHT
ncbi:hypothetical protein OG943_21510 [Amycolatopsis sp. NBC_00345]|uniref:hypothetical protein n=1 Tax=Amycolatopsis sp. NBC_00345 TaxID=2975955 RepID=UPI002E260B5A